MQIDGVDKEIDISLDDNENDGHEFITMNIGSALSYDIPVEEFRDAIEVFWQKLLRERENYE